MSKCVYVPIYNQYSSSMGDTGLPLMATNLDDIHLFYLVKSDGAVDGKNVPVVAVEELRDEFIRGRNNYIIKKELPDDDAADGLIKKVEDFWDEFGEKLKQLLIAKMQDALHKLSTKQKSSTKKTATPPKKTVKKSTKKVSKKSCGDEAVSTDEEDLGDDRVEPEIDLSEIHLS